MTDPYSFGQACANVASLFSHFAVLHSNEPNFPVKEVLDIVTKLNYLGAKEVHAADQAKTNEGYLQELALSLAMVDLMGLPLKTGPLKPKPAPAPSPKPTSPPTSPKPADDSVTITTITDSN